jgi:hypothetical protein
MKPPIAITKPCPADWSQMTGDDRQRLCAQCNKHVHNLSALTPRELQHFVDRHDGTECIGYELHPDGSILTAPRWPWLRRLLTPFRHLRRGLTWFCAVLLTPLFTGCTYRTGGMISAPPPKNQTIRGTHNGQFVAGGITRPPVSVLKPIPPEQ